MNAKSGGRGLVEMERPICGGVHKGMKEKESCGMYVTGKIGVKQVEMLIDSGANVSLISYDIYNSLDARFRPQLRRYGIPMVTADGNLMRVYGCGDFIFEIGEEPCTYGHTLCVADIGVEAILGYDFLKRYEAVINMGESRLELNELCMDQENKGSAAMSVQTCEVVVSRTITVPAGSEAIAQGCGLRVSRPFVGMMEPTTRFLGRHCMMVARAVVNMGAEHVPVRVFNMSDKPITIYENTVTAQCTEVEVLP
jgi:hypothetical protein